MLFNSTKILSTYRLKANDMKRCRPDRLLVDLKGDPGRQNWQWLTVAAASALPSPYPTCAPLSASLECCKLAKSASFRCVVGVGGSDAPAIDPPTVVPVPVLEVGTAFEFVPGCFRFLPPPPFPVFRLSVEVAG